jgi:NADH-quinone oxidoreductase subunit C
MAVATTAVLDGPAVAERLETAVPGATDFGSGRGVLFINAERLLEAAAWLRDDPELDLKFLSSVSAVDLWDSFEVVYHLFSLNLNHHLVAKVRVADHREPVVPSVVSIWYGAHLQEREVYDLMGIRFEGHPAMRRIFLWEGFPGHPLRKDWLAMPGGLKPGLAHFPNQNP